MFLVDTSPSMGNMRTVELPGGQGTAEITNLEWALQFVKLKIQENVFISCSQPKDQADRECIDF